MSFVKKVMLYIPTLYVPFEFPLFFEIFNNENAVPVDISLCILSKKTRTKPKKQTKLILTYK